MSDAELSELENKMLTLSQELARLEIGHRQRASLFRSANEGAHKRLNDRGRKYTNNCVDFSGNDVTNGKARHTEVDQEFRM